MTRSGERADAVLVAEEFSEALVIDGETPFIIGVIGDFGAAAARTPMLVDRDSIEDVLAQMAVRISLPCIGEYTFRELDDFHPDRLAAAVNATLAGSEVAEPPPDSPAHRKAPDDLLEQILGRAAEPELTSPVPSSSEFGDFVQKLVEPHLTRPPDPGELRREERTARAVSEKLREILHAPAFQELEGAWRAVFMLVRRLETGEQLRICLIHVPRQRLFEALRGGGEGEMLLARTLLEYAERSLGGNGWSVLAANYMFGANDEDLALLEGLAKLGKHLGSPVVAGAKPELVGCRSWEELIHPSEWVQPSPVWGLLRRSADARYLGLAMPRFMLRLPYGRETDPCDSMEFEEMQDSPEHGDYLWANPAFACALLLGQAFERYGWRFRPGVVNEIDGLPLHVYRSGGDSKSTSCTEVWLNESSLEGMLDRGIMAIVSSRNSDVARLARFQSIADPPAQLAGGWR